MTDRQIKAICERVVSGGFLSRAEEAELRKYCYEQGEDASCIFKVSFQTLAKHVVDNDGIALIEKVRKHAASRPAKPTAGVST